MRPSRFFTRVAKGTSRMAGKPLTFAIVILMVVAWAVSGPFFGYSDSWQLTINTATTIVTFLMVFLIQATQNRDAEAMQIKLDRGMPDTDAPEITVHDQPASPAPGAGGTHPGR